MIKKNTGAWNTPGFLFLLVTNVELLQIILWNVGSVFVHFVSLDKRYVKL